MALSFTSTNAMYGGTTSASVIPTAGSTATSVNILTTVAKPYTATITAPAGWTALETVTSGTAASALNSGSTVTKVFYKFGAIGVTPVVVTADGNVVGGHILTVDKAATEVFEFYTHTTGFDGTNNTSYSAPGADNLSLAAGDNLIVCSGLNSTATAPGSFTLTATGSTFAAGVSRVGDVTTSGDRARISVFTNVVSTGPSSGVPTFGYTDSGNSEGGTVYIRMRAVTPTITVDYATDSDENPGIQISLTGLPTEDGFEYKVSHLAASGEYPVMAVRGADMIEATSAITEHTDYEAPLDQDLSYTLYIYDGDTLVSQNAATPSSINLLSEVDGGAPLEYFHLAFLKNVTTPSLSRRIPLVDFSRWTTPGRVLSNSNVLGRKNPVVVTDVTGGKKGSFSFLTWTNVDFSGYLYKDFIATMDEIELLLESGDTLLFQTTSQFTGKDIFMKIEDISVTRLNKPPVSVPVAEDHEHTPCLMWELTFVEVDRPATEGLEFSVGTWQEVLDDPAYDDWQGVNDTFGTWLDVLQYYSA